MLNLTSSNSKKTGKEKNNKKSGRNHITVQWQFVGQSGRRDGLLALMQLMLAVAVGSS